MQNLKTFQVTSKSAQSVQSLDFYIWKSLREIGKKLQKNYDLVLQD